MAAMNDRPSSPRLGYLDLGMLLYLGAVWGAAFLFLRVAAPEVGPVWTAEIRIALAGAALALLVGPRRLWALRHRLRSLGVVGLTFSALPFSLLAFATLTLPAALASLLMATTPLFTALISTLWLGQRLSRSSIVGLGVGFTAVVVLLGGSTATIGPETAVAFLAGLGAALSYAVAGTYVRRSTNGIKPLDLAAGQLLAGAAVLLPIAILSGPPRLPALDGAVSLGLMALVSTAIAWPVFFRLSERTNATTASTVTFIVPMFGILWGGLILGEPIGPQLLVGFGLVLVSLVLVLQFPLGRIREVTDALGHPLAWRRQLRARPTS
jgi:drug/metabolite transporter (DMT)-like permease